MPWPRSANRSDVNCAGIMPQLVLDRTGSHGTLEILITLKSDREMGLLQFAIADKCAMQRKSPCIGSKEKSIQS